jgi:lysophospholipase L1-like esterase
VIRTFYCLLLLAAPASVALGQGFAFQPTDKVVLLGGTLVEREQKYGYWETALTARYPGIAFRNLGWSGDTVNGIARRRFDLDKPDIGRQRAVELVLAEKPTVILICYGTNESYYGAAGLAAFLKTYETLLTELAPAKARIALLSPTPLEDKGAPLPNPNAANKNLAVYRDAIRDLAKRRNVFFGDLFKEFGEGAKPLPGPTDNGLHLTDDGYRRSTPAFLAALGLPSEGGYSDAWEPVRKAVREKNELYFHRWRPQNETYLFGFRKHEQGKNGKEIAEFDPLVAKAEETIRGLLKK